MCSFRITPLCLICWISACIYGAAVAEGQKAPMKKDDSDIRPIVLKGHVEEVRHVVFSPDDKMIASTGRDGTVVLWDVATAKEVRRLPQNKNYIAELAFSPDGKTLATYGRFYDGKVRVWDVQSGTLRYEFEQRVVGAGFDKHGCASGVCA